MQHDTTPVVTVLMTTHAADAELVRLSLDSVLGQTYPAFELVIVVDGAIGEPLAEVLASLDGDDRVVLLRPGKVGRGAALNIGLAAANGRFIAIQDSDDESHPERLERQVRVLEQHPEIDLLATDSIHTFSRDVHADWVLEEGTGDIERLDRQLLTRNVVVHTSVMVRASLYDRLGGYDAGRRRYFDYDLYLRAREVDARLAHLHRPLVLQRSHESQSFASERNFRERVEDLFRLQLGHVRHEPLLVRSWYTIGVCLRIPVRFARASLRRRRMVRRGGQ